MAASMPTTAAGRWAAFAAWALVGAAVAFGLLGLLTIGVLILVGAAVLGALVWRRFARCGLAGVVSGLGVPLLYVAALNWQGPGVQCVRDGDPVSCADRWSPWLWLVAGLVLVLGGVALRIRRAHG
jgi:hypothetical protein